MKKIYGLLALLLLVAGCTSTALPTRQDSELPSSTPFLGADVIHIMTADDMQAARENIASILQLRDYTISQGEDLGENVLSTEPRTFAQAPGSARYFAEFTEENDSTHITMYGEWIPNQVSDRYGFSQYNSARVVAEGPRRSTTRTAWRRMEDIATSYGDGRVYYDRTR